MEKLRKRTAKRKDITPSLFEESDNNIFLSNLEGKSGIYIISNEINFSKRFPVKIGLAKGRIRYWESSRPIKGLRSRLEQYLLYYPRGYYIFTIILTTKNFTQKVESAIHRLLAGKQRKGNFPHSHTEEWFWLSLKDIHSLCQILDNKETSGKRVGYRKIKGIREIYCAPEYYFLSTNPGYGHQRQPKPMTTPQRRHFDTARLITTGPHKKPRSLEEELKRVDPLEEESDDTTEETLGDDISPDDVIDIEVNEDEDEDDDEGDDDDDEKDIQTTPVEQVGIGDIIVEDTPQKKNRKMGSGKRKSKKKTNQATHKSHKTRTKRKKKRYRGWRK